VNGGNRHGSVVRDQDLLHDFAAQVFEFPGDDGTELVFYAAVIDFVAGGYHADLHGLEGFDFDYGEVLAGDFLHPDDLFFVGEQRDDPGPGDVRLGHYPEVGVERGQNHFFDVVDPVERLNVHLEQSPDDRLHGHFAFRRFGHADAVAADSRGDSLGCFVFVDVALLEVEYVDIVLAEVEELRNVFLQDNVSFFKSPAGELTRNDAGYVVKKYCADSLLDRYFFHHGVCAFHDP